MYLSKSELFEIELFICIKMDMAINNQQLLICHKNQPSSARISFWMMVSLFNGISTLCRLFNAKVMLLEEQQWYYLTHCWEDKGVHTFPEGICPKVNVIARLEYELAYYDSSSFTSRWSGFFFLSIRFSFYNLNGCLITYKFKVFFLKKMSCMQISLWKPEIDIILKMIVINFALDGQNTNFFYNFLFSSGPNCSLPLF